MTGLYTPTKMPLSEQENDTVLSALVLSLSHTEQMYFGGLQYRLRPELADICLRL